MKIVKVGCRIGMKLNIGNYSSVEGEAWAEAELDPTDAPGSAMTVLRQFLHKEVRKQLEETVPPEVVVPPIRTGNFR